MFWVGVLGVLGSVNRGLGVGVGFRVGGFCWFEGG